MCGLMHAAHKVYDIKYHLILIVKYRRDLFLDPEHVSFLQQIVREIEKRYFLVTETMGVDEDHVHLLMQAAPRYSPSHVVQILKSITARCLFEKYPEIKKELWGGEFWSDGGYIGTVGEGVNAEIIREYIKNQGRNDAQLRLYEFAAA